MNSHRRHPRHETIAALLREGTATDHAVARAAGVSREAVARVRQITGLPRVVYGTSVYDKLDRFSTDPDPEGHIYWTGRTSLSGTPSIRHRRREIPAAAVAFRRRTGLWPEGTCRSDCGVAHCLAPGHVSDLWERRRTRLCERVLRQMPDPWEVCPSGHEWGFYGRVEPDLTLYCFGCSRERYRRSRERLKWQTPDS